MARFNQQDNLIGQSNSFLEVLEQVSQIAPLSKPVLIIGEREQGYITYQNAGIKTI